MFTFKSINNSNEYITSILVDLLLIIYNKLKNIKRKQYLDFI